MEFEEISDDYKGTERMISYPSRHFEQPSMEEFNEKIFRLKLPAVLTGDNYIAAYYCFCIEIKMIILWEIYFIF